MGPLLMFKFEADVSRVSSIFDWISSVGLSLIVLTIMGSSILTRCGCCSRPLKDNPYEIYYKLYMSF